MQRLKKMCFACVAIAVSTLAPGNLALAQVGGTATIGGEVFAGRQVFDTTQQEWVPDYDTVTGTQVLNARVMVQNQHSGGKIITYGVVTGNSWTATVPAPGDYVVMFAANGYDSTSREFTVIDGDSQTKNAWLPPLFTRLQSDPLYPAPTADELPLAGLLVYSFMDNYINSEDDAPDDPPLNGVTWTVTDDDGLVLATGVTGTQPTITLPSGMVITNTAGLYYFTNLPPGGVIATSDPSTAYMYDVNGSIPLPVVDPATGTPLDFNPTTEFYSITTEEGGKAWDPKLYPGDPGTEAGAYLIWHGYVVKVGQYGDPTNPNPFNPTLVGSVTGSLIDSDAPNLDPAEPFPVPGQDHPGVSLNTRVGSSQTAERGLVVLYSFSGNTPVRPVATTEATPVTPRLDPVTGEQMLDPITGNPLWDGGDFSFVNVPPGTYKIFNTTTDLSYVWTQNQLSLFPNQVLALPPSLVPRFFGRVQGFVYNNGTIPPTPMPGATVNIRYKDGSIQFTTTTDANGWYNFEYLPEIEVLGHVDVEPPPGFRGAIRTEAFFPNGILGNQIPGGPPFVQRDYTFNAQSRYVQWLTANYRSDLYLEPIPAGEAHIDGFVFNDNLSKGNWIGDGLYQPGEERTMHAVPVELYDSTGTILLATSTTGSIDETGPYDPVTQTGGLASQGWIPPYSVPADELGGVYVGSQIGYYEFRTADYDANPLTPPTPLLPGDYVVKLPLPLTPDPTHPLDGYSMSPPGAPNFVQISTVGGNVKINFGVNSRPDPLLAEGVPLAGEIEGGVFDDLFLDLNSTSTLFAEKQGLPGVPIVVYDHLGYVMGVGYMGNPECNAANNAVRPPGSTPGCDSLQGGANCACPTGEPLIQKPEMERRFAPGVHIYVGNDPTQIGFNPDYMPLVLPYSFGQGKFKFEADWSLVPVSQIPPQNVPVNPWINGPFLPPYPNPLPLIDNVAPLFVGGFAITGQNFGTFQKFSTVTLAGERLKVISWSDTQIQVQDPLFPISGPLIISAQGVGPSNSYPLAAGSPPPGAKYVDEANPGTGDGSVANPYHTITEALNNLTPDIPHYIFVAGGKYQEQIHIVQSDIRIIGENPNTTVLDGTAPIHVGSQGFNNGPGPVITIGAGGMKGGVSNIVISGFKIARGSVNQDSVGGGIFGDYGNSNIDINNCIITDNGGYYGGGIWLHKSNHDVKIWSNEIYSNGNFGGYGGGISVNDEPEYGPEHSQPEHVVDDHFPGPPPGTYEITNNYIHGNFASDYGGGVCLYEVKDHLIIAGNVIEDNYAWDHGGGLYFEDTGPIDIYGNQFVDNYSRDDGGAISFEDVGDDISLVQVFDNVFEGNVADDTGESTAVGGAIALDDSFYVEIFNNTIVNNMVAGSNHPAGGAIDSERNGHEYNGSCPDCSDYAPGYSEPRIYNNLIRDNVRLHYDQPPNLLADGESVSYEMGINYVWSMDNLHVDNPALNAEWESYLNSESFAFVQYNNISNGEYLGRQGAIDLDPLFVDPGNYDFRLLSGSPGIDAGATHLLPSDLLDLNGNGCTNERLPIDIVVRPRFADDLSTPNTGCASAVFVDMGAHEYLSGAIVSTVVVGDINGNGAINIDDLVAVLNAFGACGGCCPADLNGNGAINIDDLVGVLNAFGGACP